MVLDDAAHAAQVRPLLPAGAGCAVIVTSRSPLTALDGAHRFPLAPLSDDESAALLRAASGRAAGLDAAHPLVALTGRLPLALRVVAARLAARRALTPDALAGQLAATEGRLHHLEYDDLSVRRSLAVAHEALRASDREADRDAAHALQRIGALDLPAYGAPSSPASPAPTSSAPRPPSTASSTWPSWRRRRTAGTSPTTSYATSPANSPTRPTPPRPSSRPFAGTPDAPARACS